MKQIVYPVLALAALFFASCSPKSEMDRFVDQLMSKMTVEEKIGQLNLPVTGDIVTGELKSSDVSNRVREGEVGGLFNLKGTESIRAIQKIAVEESRLGIPLLIGMDVISLCDFAITNLDMQTKFSFQVPSTLDIDFEKSNTILHK